MSSSQAAKTDPNAPEAGRPWLREVPPPEPRVEDIRPAGFWRRLPAVLIDGALLYGVEQVTFHFMGIAKDLGVATTASQALSFSPEQIRAQLLAFAFGALYQVGYCYAFYRWKGATLGKLALGLKVVDVETGETIGLGQTVLREFFGKSISLALFFGGYLVAAFRRDKRALHDFVGGTQVRRR